MDARSNNRETTAPELQTVLAEASHDDAVGAGSSECDDLAEIQRDAEDAALVISGFMELLRGSVPGRRLCVKKVEALLRPLESGLEFMAADLQAVRRQRAGERC